MEETDEQSSRIYQKLNWYLFLSKFIFVAFSMAFYFCMADLSFTVTRDYLAEDDTILTLI